MSGEQGNGAGAAILARMGVLEAKLDALMAHLGMGARRSGNADKSSASSGGDVADLADIQGQYGDVKIRMNPRRWTGEPMKGRTASQCPAEFLDIFAEQLEYFAGKQEDSKKAEYDRRDARRCRRWAVEIRAGRHKPDAGGSVPPPPGGTQWDRGNAPPPSDDGMAPPPADDFAAPPFGEDDGIPF